MTPYQNYLNVENLNEESTAYPTVLEWNTLVR